MSAPPTRIAVVGAGIAGLAAAHRLVELARERARPIELTLFDLAGRPGGSIATERTDGFVIEAGPDSFLSEKPAALQLCERLGLGSRLIGTREGNRRTFVVHDGRLHPLPEGFLLLAPTRFAPLVTTRVFSWPGKLRMALDLLLPRRSPTTTDESLGSFVRRRLGREALERVAQPMVGGIYTADPDQLSLAATMPRFLEMERRQRSVIWAMWRQQRQAAAAAHAGSGARWSLFVSLDDGMQTLVDRLAQALPEGVLRLHTAVEALSRHAEAWRLAVEGGPVDVDAVILAIPASRTASLLSALDNPLAAELGAIPYASSATVSLAYRASSLPHPLDGFGFVVPHVEGRAIIACTYSSMKFAGRAPEGIVLLRAFVGGALQEERFAQDDATMAASVRSELWSLLGIRDEPLLTRIHRHPRAMPQYRVGHLDRVDVIEARAAALPRLALCGNAYRGIGIPDCVRSGEDAAAALWDRLSAREA